MTSLQQLLKMKAAVILGSLAAFSFAGQAFGQVIRLQEQVTAEPKQNIRLGDVATVTGVDAKTAEGLLNLVILPEVSEGRTVRAEAVLMAVIAQVGPGKLADQLQVSGAATCDVHMAGEAEKIAKNKRPAKTVPVAVATVDGGAVTNGTSADAAAAQPAKVEAKKVAGPALSKLIVERLQQDLAVGPEDLRVNFDTMNPLLDQPAPGNSKWAFRPMTHNLLGTVQYEAQLVDGSRVVQKLTVQMQVLKRQMTFVTTAAVSRGDVMTKSVFKVEESWLDRPMPTYLTNEKDVIGLEALRDLNLGTTLDQRDFRPVSMAARNDIISVIFVHGNMKVQMKGRAAGDGKLHDSIQIKNEETNEVYDAVLIGKRLAYVGEPLSEPQEKKLREAR